MIFYLILFFLTSILGMRTNIIGLIDRIAETAPRLLKIYSGALSDKLHRRKRLVVTGYARATLAKPFL